MNIEVIKKTYQFDIDDTYVIAEVDLFHRTLRFRQPLWFRLFPLRTKKYWEWIHVCRQAEMHIARQYGITKIIE